jgi:hyperosmotically inducible protein
MKFIKYALVIVMAASLQACVAAAIGGGAAGGYAVAKDRGTVGQYTSDSIITSKIKTKYLADIHLKSYNISVTTESGHVTLTGSVPTAQMRASAIADARNTVGVRSVNVTNFTVKP